MIDYPHHLSMVSTSAAFAAAEFRHMEIIIQKAAFNADVLTTGRNGPHGIAVTFVLNGFRRGDYFTADWLENAPNRSDLYRSRLESLVKLLVSDVLNGNDQP